MYYFGSHTENLRIFHLLMTFLGENELFSGKCPLFIPLLPKISENLELKWVNPFLPNVSF